MADLIKGSIPTLEEVMRKLERKYVDKDDLMDLDEKGTRNAEK